jgi:hypothetical protein
MQYAAKTSNWDFKRALEVVLSEMDITGFVPGVYDLHSAFMIAVKEEQDKAKIYLKTIEG